MVNWKQKSTYIMQGLGTNNEGVTFATEGEHEETDDDMALITDRNKGNKNDGKRKKEYQGTNFDNNKVICHECKKNGHHVPQCPKTEELSSNPSY
jgi:hypothetical protein